MTPNAAKQMAALQIAKAVIDSIRETGERGLPGGTIYAALMTHGCTMEQFETLMRSIVDTGLISRDGNHLYRYVGPNPEGKP